MAQKDANLFACGTATCLFTDETTYEIVHLKQTFSTYVIAHQQCYTLSAM